MTPAPPERTSPEIVRPFVVAGLVLIAAALVINEWTLGLWLTERGRITNHGIRAVLALADLAVICAGILLIVRRGRAPWRQMLLLAGSTLFALILAEAGVRVWFAVLHRTAPRDREIAEAIGWRPTANLTLEGDQRGFGYVSYHTTHDGFRVFGDPKTTRTKLFVVGDSYTEGMMVSDADTYYAQLARAMPGIEMFAIGGGGYGTLQEYMLVDQWVDVIKPDVILLQMHPNDLINNSHALESRSTNNNNQMTRPYWENGRVVMKFPENQAWGPLYNLAEHSYLVRLLNVNLNFLRARSAESVERGLAADDPDVVRATAATVEVLVNMQRRAGKPVVVFSTKTDGYFPFWSVSDVCLRADVRFIPGVGEAVDAADDRGESVTGKPYDAHWNAAGHAIAARVIAAWLETTLHLK
jgi:hypothetical protein